MPYDIHDEIKRLNSSGAGERLEALARLRAAVDNGEITLPPRERDINNHIHTTYSFSPYSPAKAVWKSCEAGLCTCGIVDHDSVSGCREFVEAGRIMDIPVTIGAELRADMSATQFRGRRLNNTDQPTVAYVTLHGIPHTQIDAVSAYIAPYLARRHGRNLRMTANITALLGTIDSRLALDYESDVRPLSQSADGGSVTERHLLCALVGKMNGAFGRGADAAEFLEKRLGIALSAKGRAQLLEEGNPHYDYDLLGILKSEFLEHVFVPATDECPPIAEVADFTAKHGIVLAYAYLGDIGDSVTGDKKAQAFEDAYLDELMEALPVLGFNAVTYMPSRNTDAQLGRIRALCVEHNLFQICGEDINQTRQQFVCEPLRRPEFANLYHSTWALIGHERRATKDLGGGMFSPETVGRLPGLDARIAEYAAWAMANK